MSKPRLLPVACLLLLFIAGCSKPPDEVRVIKTPVPNVFLTFETWNNGPLVSDRQKLVAHYTRDDKSDTQTILDGDYLVVSKYSWPNPKELIICLKSGATRVYTNEATLWIGDAHQEFHVTLQDRCGVER